MRYKGFLGLLCSVVVLAGGRLPTMLADCSGLPRLSMLSHGACVLGRGHWLDCALQSTRLGRLSQGGGRGR